MGAGERAEHSVKAGEALEVGDVVGAKPGRRKKVATEEVICRGRGLYKSNKEVGQRGLVWGDTSRPRCRKGGQSGWQVAAAPGACPG